MPSEVDFDQCWGGLGAGRRERSRLRAVPSEGTEIDLERAGSSEVDLEQCQSEGAEMDLERAGSIGVDFEKEGGTKSAYSMMIFSGSMRHAGAKPIRQLRCHKLGLVTISIRFFIYPECVSGSSRHR